MKEWLKKVGSYIVGGLIMVLTVLFGTERVRRKRAEKQRDTAKNEATKAKTEVKAEKKVSETVTEVAEKIEAVDRKTDELKESVKDEETTYNDIVDSFNRVQ